MVGKGVFAMPQINVEEVVYHLDSEFKKALDDMMGKFAQGTSYNRDELFKYFLKRVYHHCSIWEKIPDRSVKP